MTTPLPRSRLAVPFLLSGFAGLVYQIAWARLLRLAFGATSEAVATVLAAFMAGLALGSAVGGRLADRRGPMAALRLYALLEIGIAVLSLASAAILGSFSEIFAMVEGVLGAGRLARSLAAGLVLLPPTMLMGATLPVLTRALVTGRDGIAPGVAWLYAVNTAGAVLGALATGFVLLPVLGVTRSIVAAAILNGLSSALVYRLTLSTASSEVLAPTGGEGRVRGRDATSRALVLVSAAISGATALGLEVLWTRTIVLTVGSSTQSFSLMLVTFLAGIALGSALYARLTHRLWPDARLAGLLQLGVAVSSVLLLRLADTLPWLYVSLWERVPEGGVGLAVLRLVPCVALMLPPALLMGASLPSLVRAFARREDAVGSDVGGVYAVNTAGAIAGSLAVGLFALPHLGVARAATAVAFVGLLGAAAAILSARRAGASGTASLLAAVALAAAGLAWTPPWDPRVMGRGLSYIANRLGDVGRGDELKQAIANIRVVYYRDGRESSVLVYDGGEGTQRSFAVNGRHEATSSPNDMRNQYLLAHLPALLHRGPVREGLVIALGSGMTAGCLARHAERVTVVELEREVIGAAAEFAAWNHAVLNDPRVTVVVDDGRRFLQSTAARYDVITVDPIHPAVAGSEALYSREQYELVRRRLAPGGVAAQWLPLYQMGIDDARIISRTFQEVFADAQIWVNGADAILIGGAGETLRPLAGIRDALARPEVAASLAAVRQDRLGTFMAGYALGPAEVRRYSEGARISTDDRPILEFSLPRRIYGDTVDKNLLEIFRFASRDAPGSAEGLSPAELEEVERASSAMLFNQIALALRAVGHDQTMREFFERALALNPDDVLARQAVGR